MAHRITEERIKAVQSKIDQNKIELSDPDYEEVEGYQHLDVLKSERGYYKIEAEDKSVETRNASSGLSKLSNFLNDYNSHGNLYRAYQNNYSSSNTKAKEIEEIIREVDHDLTDDLEKLAEDLDPT